MTGFLIIAWHWLKTAFYFFVDNWRFWLIVFGLIGLLAAAIFTFRYCEKRKITIRQNESDNANFAVIEAGSETNQAIKNLENANKKAQEIENSKETNVNFSTANRNRCLAFPDSKGCK